VEAFAQTISGKNRPGNLNSSLVSAARTVRLNIPPKAME
jgi:hypothetical protein